MKKQLLFAFAAAAAFAGIQAAQAKYIDGLSAEGFNNELVVDFELAGNAPDWAIPDSIPDNNNNPVKPDTICKQKKEVPPNCKPRAEFDAPTCLNVPQPNGTIRRECELRPRITDDKGQINNPQNPVKYKKVTRQKKGPKGKPQYDPKGNPIMEDVWVPLNTPTPPPPTPKPKPKGGEKPKDKD